MTIAAIIPAAGRSSRFDGGNKLLTSIKGEPLVRHVLLEVAKAPVSDIVLVTGPDAVDVMRAAGEGPWRIAVNRDAGEGMASSIRSGIAALAADAEGALIVPADMPLMSASLVASVIGAFRTGGARCITFPVSTGRQHGHPVLWPRSYFVRLSHIHGDAGGKALIASAPQDCLPVRCDDAGAFIDIDTQADLETLRHRF